jgi:hypothetical protein
MVTLPPQNPPVYRDPLARPPGEQRDAECAAWRSAGGVESSQSRCDHLTGPAQSLCYSALYGVSV